MSTKKSKYADLESYDSKSPLVFEKFKLPTKTIEGESYTVRELFERHLQGALPDVIRDTYNSDQADFDSIDFQALSNADPYVKSELLRDVQEKAQRAIDSLEKYKLRKRKEQLELFDDEDDNSSPPSKPKPRSRPSVSGERGSKRSDATNANSDTDEEDSK